MLSLTQALCIMRSSFATWYFISTILPVTMYSESVAVKSGSSSCPVWFSFSNTSQQCVCDNLEPWGIHCNQKEMKVEIADGYCVTSAGEFGPYYAGDCVLQHTQNKTNRMYSELPSDPDLLNDVICGPYKRKGLLCGRCIDGYGPPVYSFGMKCVNCSKYSTPYAICLYLLLECIPITVFFICAVTFRLNIMAGPLLGYAIFCQTYAFGVQRYMYIYLHIISHVSAPLQVLLDCSMMLSAIWILQFLKFVVPAICISEKLTGIQVQMLGLVTPIYLIVLVILTCTLMELHARNYRIVTIVWKPFSMVLTKMNVVLSTKDAIIHAFSTSILLSAYTLNYIMITTITHNPVSSSDGTFYNYLVFCDPTITWFSHKHIVYLLIAVVPYVLLVVIPSLLLCVYPMRIYGFLSQYISARKQLAITAFVEALHNCFKDGLSGTRDYRSLAGLSIVAGTLFPLIVFYIYKFTGYTLEVTTGFILFIISIIVANLRPCKTITANISLSYHCMVIGIFSITLGLWKNDLSTATETLTLMFIFVPIISHILVLSWAGYTLIHRIVSFFQFRLFYG